MTYPNIYSYVDWIKHFQDNWTIERVKDYVQNDVYGTSQSSQDSGSYEILGMGDIDNGQLNFPGKKYHSNIPRELVLKKNDLLLNRTNSLALVGKVGIFESDRKNVSFASYLIRLRLKKSKAHPRYFNYLFNSNDYVNHIRSLATQTANQANINASRYKLVPIPICNIAEQIKVADYLDRKTAAIDKEIKILREKISLYEKLLCAFINEAVCKGLNSNCSLKQSNIEWIGNIPHHWTIERPKDKFVLKKKLVGELSENYKLLSLTQNGVILREIDSGLGKFPAEFNSYQIVNPNDLIFCLFDVDVTPRTVGYSELHGMITGAYTIFTTKRGVYNKYYYYLFLMADLSKKLSKYYTGLRNTIKKETFLSLEIPVPPFEEQEQIANYLDEKTQTISRIILNLSQQIDKLKDLRSALINDSVLGKLKLD